MKLHTVQLTDFELFILLTQVEGVVQGSSDLLEIQRMKKKADELGKAGEAVHPKLIALLQKLQRCVK